MEHFREHEAGEPLGATPFLKRVAPSQIPLVPDSLVLIKRLLVSAGDRSAMKDEYSLLSCVVSVPWKRFQQTQEDKSSPNNPKRSRCDEDAEMEIESYRIVVPVRPVRPKEAHHNEFARGVALPSYKESADS
jgi:hypothetical protein